MTREEYIKAIKSLNMYTEAYDKGTPLITDKEWDDIYFNCASYEEETGYIDPASPTSSIQFEQPSNLQKITHDHPMLSLAKTKKIDELKKWLKESTVVMLKMDGLTCSLKYVDGKLISAETRGNGIIGEDITENAKCLSSIPKTINATGTVTIDGEVICKYDDFEEFSDIYKNPRNFASGSIRLDDPNECEKRHLTFVAWDMISSHDNLIVKLNIMRNLGFTVVDYEVTDDANLEDQQNRLKTLAASHFYPIDGLVYKINDYDSYMSKGHDDHHFRGGLAWKFYDQLFETELTGIEWSVAKTGKITPVANFKAVVIDGATIQNASLHNISIMRQILGEKPFIGQKIWVTRANMVIPQVIKAIKNN